MKRGLAILPVVFILIFSIFSFPVLYAQEENVPDITASAEEPQTTTESQSSEITEPSTSEIQETSPLTETETPEIVQEIEKEFENAELKEGAGITPDNAFYFIEDGILSNFRGDLENREKKVAEIQAMVESGNIDAAKESLERYERYADNLEREVNPERRDDAFRSAVAIRRTINEITDDIPEENREEFTNVLEREENIVTATEISSKIKELCETLSKLDPLEYSRICKTEEDSPRWQKDLNQKLTKEQEQEAKAFFEIMSQCFDTSGKQCRCEDISVSAFAEKCSTIAPLAAECNDGNENACDEMEKIEKEEPIEDLLPEHLQGVLSRLEGRYNEDRYDMRMPPECIEEGATTPKECMKVMFRLNAPEECQAALERGEINPSNEREARESCEKIMFKANAPPECVEAGVTNPKECGKIMFKANAPEECIAAGITGENRGDEKKCREIMENQRREEGPREGGFRGGNCGGIQDSTERLKCYDSASQGFGEQFERAEGDRREVREYREEKGGQKCPDNMCDEFEQSHSYACPEDCGGTREQFRPPQEEFQQPPEEFREPPREGEFQQPPSDEFQQPPEREVQPPQEESQSPTPTTEPSPESSGSESSSGGESSGGGESAPTGSVIFSFNDKFSDYYFR